MCPFIGDFANTYYYSSFERRDFHMKELTRNTTNCHNTDSNNTNCNNLKTVADYDDGNIPQEDLPQDVIPDEVPRKDGPGGESGK